MFKNNVNAYIIYFFIISFIALVMLTIDLSVKGVSEVREIREEKENNIKNKGYSLIAKYKTSESKSYPDISICEIGTLIFLNNNFDKVSGLSNADMAMCKLSIKPMSEDIPLSLNDEKERINET